MRAWPFMLNHMVNNQSEGLDSIFGALSDQTRRAILARLSRGESTVTELAEPFEMSLAAVSKHIRVLEEAGLVTKIKEGRIFRCRANIDGLKKANAVLEELAGYWNSRLDALDKFLNEGGKNDGKRTAESTAQAGSKKSIQRKKRKGV